MLLPDAFQIFEMLVLGSLPWHCEQAAPLLPNACVHKVLPRAGFAVAVPGGGDDAGGVGDEAGGVGDEAGGVGDDAGGVGVVDTCCAVSVSVASFLDPPQAANVATKEITNSDL